MKKFAFVIALCFVAGSAIAAPVAYQLGSGDPNIVPSGRDVCWSEPADLNGLIGSSEQILAFGLETELANDFVPNDIRIIHATWWGGFWNNTTPCVSGITTPGFNLRVYEDAGCVPGTVIADFATTSFTEESVGCQAGAYPMFKWGADVCFEVIGDNLYWFSAQMIDHAFPPQAGRLASAGVVGCDTVFKSVYFAYPDWTPAIDVFGVAFDCSQEFTCASTCIVATQPSTWGQIKGLYR
jgi:hypothetical protein